MNLLPKTRHCSVVWEAHLSLDVNFKSRLVWLQVVLQTGAGDAKIVASKPKLFLTAQLTLPPQTWVKVS